MTWTNITNAQLAIGAPVRSIDLLALRDNITAQANGDAGAPKQQAAGINYAGALSNVGGALAVQVGNGLAISSSVIVSACPTLGTVGSYAFAGGSFYGEPGFSVAGGELAYSGVVNGGELRFSYPLSGTWRTMGIARGDASGLQESTLFCRIS